MCNAISHLWVAGSIRKGVVILRGLQRNSENRKSVTPFLGAEKAGKNEEMFFAGVNRKS